MGKSKGFLTVANFSVWILFLATPSHAFAESPGAPIVLEKFKVNKNGDALLVPVKVGDKGCLFMVDTGATATVFDRSFSLGTPKRREQIETPNGDVLINFYDVPESTVGTYRLDKCLDEVGSFDFKMIRRVSGHQICGVLGMDFLKRHVVKIDFDSGLLALLKAADPRFGSKSEIKYSLERPMMSVDISGHGKELFIIDTGRVGLGTGSLKSALSATLIDRHGFRELGSGSVEAVGGTIRTNYIQGKCISIADMEVRNPIFDKSDSNLLGLTAICRFNVTFDFPKNEMYLRKSSNFERPDRFDRSGLKLLRHDDGVEVHSVKRQSAAEKADLRAGDVLQQLGDVDTGKTSMFEIRMLFEVDPIFWTA